MIRYLNTPLKVTGILLTLAGAVLTVITFQHADFTGVSVLSLGVVVLLTGLMIPRSSVPATHRIVLELFLIFVILFIAAVLVMDYYGIIMLRRFISIL
jgi:hypothetical protein